MNECIDTDFDDGVNAESHSEVFEYTLLVLYSSLGFYDNIVFGTLLSLGSAMYLIMMFS